VYKYLYNDTPLEVYDASKVNGNKLNK